MSDTTLEIVKLSLQVIIAVGVLGAAVFSWMSKKAIQQVHVSLNGRMTQLLEKTESSSRAEGRDSMRAGDGRDLGSIGPVGPAGTTGAQGPIGVQGPAGAQGVVGPPGEVV